MTVFPSPLYLVLTDLDWDDAAFDFHLDAGWEAGHDDPSQDGWAVDAVLIAATLGDLSFSRLEVLDQLGAAHVARIEAARAEAHRETLEAEAPGGRVGRAAA